VPYIKALRQDKRYESIMGMVEIAVRAIEQTRKEQGQGKLKKAEVETFITEWLADQGIKITEKELDQLIECAVYQMKQGI
jgi:LL-H family phage holin